MENGLIPKTFTGKGTNEQRKNYSRYLNEQVSIHMRPELSNRNIQENFRQANKDYYKQRKKN